MHLTVIFAELLPELVEAEWSSWKFLSLFAVHLAFLHLFAAYTSRQLPDWPNLCPKIDVQIETSDPQKNYKTSFISEITLTNTESKH